MPRRVRPMLAASAPEPFDSPSHLFEPKWDGVRAIGFRDGERVWLHSRRGLAYTDAFPEVALALARVPGPRRAVVDGELVTAGPDGRPSIAAVLARTRMRRPAAIRAAALEWPAAYVIFDLLYIDGQDLRHQPLQRRRAELERWAPAWGRPDGCVQSPGAPPAAAGSNLVLSPGVVGQGRRLFAAIRERGLEGMMAKALRSPYREGRRSPDWLKVKAFVQAQAVVVGFVPSGKTGVRSLAVALPQAGEAGPHRCELDFAGLVGTGMPASEQARLRARLEPLRLTGPARPLRPSAFLGRLARPELRGVVWVTPQLACRIRYLERTADGWLRHASYRGLAPGSAGATGSVGR